MPVYSDGWSETFKEDGIYLVVLRKGVGTLTKVNIDTTDFSLMPALTEMAKNAVARKLGDEGV